ncbi:hypothetical protein EUTSA_v10005572mg [Eutrema salsugineum]|uniref:Uncharacterized protein n=1 Tax=Eutrema salsugineum TaxID=72664 RepID=V4MK23_EUTSA|nr:hypothetical protein EUTSA_v10005572mg [Eutrema salsugineum]
MKNKNLRFVNVLDSTRCKQKYVSSDDILVNLARVYFAQGNFASMVLKVSEAENAVCVCSQLSAASDLHVLEFNGKNTNHVQYFTHLLEAAKVHREAAE